MCLKTYNVKGGNPNNVYNYFNTIINQPAFFSDVMSVLHFRLYTVLSFPLFCHVQVPAFETKDGKCIYESNAIAYYGMFLYGHLISIFFIFLMLL